MSTEVDLEGMTDTDCCDECRQGHCQITGLDHCGHPNKGGIQAVHRMNPDILRRYNGARRVLRKLAAERTANDD